jgi:hypothetical protein
MIKSFLVTHILCTILQLQRKENNPEYGGIMILLNAAIHPLLYMTQQPKKIYEFRKVIFFYFYLRSPRVAIAQSV